MAERVTSRTNPYIQHVRRLYTDRKYRYACRAFVADGTKLAAEALRWAEVEAVLTREGLAFPVPEGVRHIEVPETLMTAVSRMETPQGALCVCRMPQPAPLTLAPGTLILDGIQDPGNLGTILRTADAFSVPVVLSDGCADPWGEKTVRAAMGAVFRSPPQQAAREELLRLAAEQGLPLCVTALSETARDIRTLDLRGCLTVIGSEGRGVSEAFLAAASMQAIIPMSPHCESLNAAVAATIVLWQIRGADGRSG